MTDTTNTEPRYAVEINDGRVRVLDAVLDADEALLGGSSNPSVGERG
jgi:hypothetical protein